MSKEVLYTINMVHLEEAIEKVNNEILTEEDDENIDAYEVLSLFEDYWVNYGTPCPITHKGVFLYPEAIIQDEDVYYYIHVLTHSSTKTELDDIKSLSLTIPDQKQGGQVVH